MSAEREGNYAHLQLPLLTDWPRSVVWGGRTSTAVCREFSGVQTSRLLLDRARDLAFARRSRKASRNDGKDEGANGGRNMKGIGMVSP